MAKYIIWGKISAMFMSYSKMMSFFHFVKLEAQMSLYRSPDINKPS